MATYRLQMYAGFGFAAASEVAGYLARLGVSHVYFSPLLQAARGSTHGYDAVDPTRVNEELGGLDAHSEMCRALGARGLGQVVDIVPNHMAITPENAWWWDVLEDGPASRYARYFDVDWDPPEEKLRNTVLIPVLADHYGRVLEAGEIRLFREAGRFTIRYHDHVLPLAPRSLDTLLEAAAGRCASGALAEIAVGFGSLPLATETDPAARRERHRGKQELKQRLARLLEEDASAAAAVDERITEINRSPDALDELLDRQNYRLAHWRTAGRELDYRRFFDISTLAALRVEDEQVFLAVHGVVLDWLSEKVVAGVRVDHVDGLRDPEGYLARLRAHAPDAWILVEKILEHGERLREAWPVAGTTGYDFLSACGGLFVDPGGEAALTELYASFTGVEQDFATIAWENRHLVMRELLGSDVGRLTGLLVRICERHRRYRDYTRHELHEAVRELIACFPVYRTYVEASQGRVTADDVRWIERAVAEARRRRPDLDEPLLRFLGDIILLRVAGGLEGEFVMRLQQTTGSVMAKGVEDTAFYVYNRFVALNEVGGDPGRFGCSVEELHEANAEALARWPDRMTATSTHDTKRSEDVRARLALLSEIPGEWAETVRRWSAMNERHRAGDLPDRNAEFLLYQTLVGAHPLRTERAAAYMEKASKEAKARTSWVNPHPEYDQALRRFVESVLADEVFALDLARFVEPLVEPGRINSLSQTLLKLASPGVPDIYQGTELWDLSLVDPDNRRPVDYALRMRLLGELEGLGPEDVWASAAEGLPKLFLIRRALSVRARLPHLFGPRGSYRPLGVRGPKSRHAVAFARGEGAAALAPRLVLGLGGDWAGTTVELPPGAWRNELTGDAVPGGEAGVADLLARFPVALLVREESG